MLFYLNRNSIYYNFDSWKIESKGTYALALIGTFLLCIFIEGINFLRFHLQA